MPRKDFDDILKIIDTNNALDEEIQDFNTNILPKLFNDESPSAENKVVVYPD